MSTQIEQRQYFVYPEDDMPESQPQIDLSDHLRSVLNTFYQGSNCFITGNLEIRAPDKSFSFQAIVPDVAVFKNLVLTPEERRRLKSWRMSQPNRPAPDVVFEISSDHTWQHDLDPKPEHYRQLGVKEYFAYDPLNLWPGTVHLRGWRYTNFVLEEIQPDAAGRLWSVELESWVAPDGEFLQLYDQDGNMRPDLKTLKQQIEQSAVAERIAREVAQEQTRLAQAQTETERIAKEAVQQQMEIERAAAETAEAALRQSEAEKAALLEELRKLRGQSDPD